MREDWLGAGQRKNFPLGELCQLVSRGTAPNYDENGYFYAIGQKCVQVSGFVPEAARRHEPLGGREVRPRPGDVLLNSTGVGTIGRSCVFPLDGDYVVDSHVTVIRPGELLDARWLNATLQSHWGQRYLDTHCFIGSTGQVELSRSELLRVPISLPSLAEQQRIAEILDELDEQLARLRNLRAKTENWLQGMRRRLISETRDGELVAIGHLGRVVTGKTPDVGPRLGHGHSIPFVTPSEIVDGEAVLDSTREAWRGEANVVEVPSGSTLVVCIGFGTGKVGLLEHRACVNQQINAVVPGGQVDPHFLFESICEASAKVKAASSLQVTPILNKSTFSQIQLFVPSFSRQKEISSVLRQVRSELDQFDVNIEKVQHLKRALMNGLLAGSD
ncbi:restriction endonuclease subunit S [Streptomyces sp. NPDC058335]|uniref:restriction endonuclease subunit S n=1 Tax=Streptomyces sp. NPDC058335 TaxID=3346451 RepID=UPI00364EEB89